MCAFRGKKVDCGSVSTHCKLMHCSMSGNGSSTEKTCGVLTVQNISENQTLLSIGCGSHISATVQHWKTWLRRFAHYHTFPAHRVNVHCSSHIPETFQH